VSFVWFVIALGKGAQGESDGWSGQPLGRMGVCRTELEYDFWYRNMKFGRYSGRKHLLVAGPREQQLCFQVDSKINFFLLVGTQSAKPEKGFLPV